MEFSVSASPPAMGMDYSASPGAFGSLDGPGMGTSFDESPDSILASGTPGALTTALHQGRLKRTASTDRPALTSRLRALSSLEQRGEIDARQKGDLKDALLADPDAPDLGAALDRVAAGSVPDAATRRALRDAAASPPVGGRVASLENDLQHLMSLEDVGSASFGGRGRAGASPRSSTFELQAASPAMFSFGDDAVAQAAAFAAAGAAGASAGDSYRLRADSYDGASSYLGGRNSFQPKRPARSHISAAPPARTSARRAASPPAAPSLEALFDRDGEAFAWDAGDDDAPGFEFELEPPAPGSPRRAAPPVRKPPTRRPAPQPKPRRAAAPPAACGDPGPNKGCSTPVDELPPLETLEKQEVAQYEQLINFNRTKGRGAHHHCVMCGREGRPPAKGGSDPPTDGLVVIPTQNKDVCKVCDTIPWRHVATGCYFKWCKGCKRFHEIQAFAGKLKASKCDASRARGRAGYMRRKEDDSKNPAPS